MLLNLRITFQIGRCASDGSQHEWLPIVGIAKSLAVHSARGKLVWNTGHSIEGSLLNGDKLETYWSPGLFSGSQGRKTFLLL